MRLIATLKDAHHAKVFSAFLSYQGIDNQCDISTNQDPNSPDLGKPLCRIWVFEEDQIESALQWFYEFQQNPTNPHFSHLQTTPPKTPEQTQTTTNRPQQITSTFSQESLGPVTLYTLILCALLFLATELTRPTYVPISPSIPYIPVYSSSLKKAMLYDYPYAYVIIDKIVHAFGIEKLQNPNELPPEGKLLLEKFYHTPYWHGMYEKIVAHFKQPDTSWNFNAPLFEKISQGEVWRLFTPCILHADIFHLFFNMIWLIIIGKQMEKRIGALRYLLFFLITGIVSNTAQYLMSGANFIGFSGILCAMIVFVWIRQKKAPWEGYFMQPATWAFIVFFILLMLGIQLVSFIVEITTQSSISPNIANTAHIVGGIMGYILGRMNFFKSRLQNI